MRGLFSNEKFIFAWSFAWTAKKKFSDEAWQFKYFKALIMKENYFFFRQR